MKSFLALLFFTLGLLANIPQGSLSADAPGSTRALADSSGQITDSYDYTPYGKLVSHDGSSENSFLFTGEQYDKETGNYYLRARYYSPDLARFLTRDTYEGTLTDPLSQNPYLYARGNPVVYVDPSGHFGIIEVQFNLGVEAELRNAQREVLFSAMKSVARDLGCDIAITYAKDILTEGVGLYLVHALDGRPYAGRTNNFNTRLRVHIRKKIGHMANIIGRIRFHKIDLTTSELNAIEELLIRAVDEMTGGNLIGMNNERYNYGPGAKDPRHGPKNSDAFNKLFESIREKCKGRK